MAVSIRGRSFKIAATADIQTSDARGVLFAHGHLFGGHALYIKDRKLVYVYNFLGENAQVMISDIDVPLGKTVLGMEFVKERLGTLRDAPPPNQCIGDATLHIDDKQVGEYKGMTTQLGKFAIAGEGLNVGRDGGAPVTFDYPGHHPFAFSGGTIARVVIDVSGQTYRDYELELAAMMNRD